MRIVFMGTPEFAVPSLQGLYAGGHEVLAVFTQPDRPKGRGKQMAAPPVKEAALELNLPVFQPESVRTDEVYGQLLELEPDAIIVVAYGKILPKRLLDLPKWGCINVHASLLPAYRGAAPIHWAIVNGETETGITIMKMDEGLDTGDMLSKKVTPIHDNNTMGELHDRLKFEGAQLLLTTLEGLQAGNVTPVPQSEVVLHTRLSSRKNTNKSTGINLPKKFMIISADLIRSRELIQTSVVSDLKFGNL